MFGVYSICGVKSFTPNVCFPPIITKPANGPKLSFDVNEFTALRLHRSDLRCESFFRSAANSHSAARAVLLANNQKSFLELCAVFARLVMGYIFTPNQDTLNFWKFHLLLFWPIPLAISVFPAVPHHRHSKY